MGSQNLKVYDNTNDYLRKRRQKDYYINFVVEENNRSFIVASIKHSFSGSKDDGIFILYKQFSDFRGIVDYHFSVHANGVCHLKLRKTGDPKHVSKKCSADLTSKNGIEDYFKRGGMKNITKMIVGELPPLMQIKGQKLVNNFSLNIHETCEHIKSLTSNDDVSKFAKYPDQIITLNRKYIKLDQVSCTLWILPKNCSFIPTNRVINPHVYIFNLLSPPIAVELHYGETFPLPSFDNQGSYDKFKYVDQIQNPRESLWINFEPSLCDGGKKLYIPSWTFWCKGNKYELPEITVPLKDGLKLYIGEHNGSDYYHLDFIGAKIPPFDRNGPICPIVVYIQNGEVNVLRGVKYKI